MKRYLGCPLGRMRMIKMMRMMGRMRMMRMMKMMNKLNKRTAGLFSSRLHPFCGFEGLRRAWADVSSSAKQNRVRPHEKRWPKGKEELAHWRLSGHWSLVSLVTLVQENEGEWRIMQAKDSVWLDPSGRFGFHPGCGYAQPHLPAIPINNNRHTWWWWWWCHDVMMLWSYDNYDNYDSMFP
jgi:hypothetical protein